MPQNSRIGDYVNMNCPHGGIGIIVEGSFDRFSEDISQARMGDRVVCCSCGMIGRVITGSDNSFVNDLPATRVGDNTLGVCNPGFRCCPHGRSGTVRNGASSVFTN